MIDTHESVDLCSKCGQPWQSHYRPELLKFKLGPWGVFGLKEGMHHPHVPVVHGVAVGES